MEKERFWQIVFYLSLIVISIWLVLKVTGVINTPAWLEFGVPIAGLVVGALALYQNFFGMINKISVGLATLTARFDHLENDVHTLKKDVNALKQKS